MTQSKFTTILRLGTLSFILIPSMAFLSNVWTYQTTSSSNYSIETYRKGSNFIDALLDDRNMNDPAYKCSHMIAIPLEQSHDLLLELESIQRGILYHCPLLINACIAPVVMRMPLLLVDTDMKSSRSNISSEALFGKRPGSQDAENADFGKGSDLLTSRDPITQKLHKIVNQVVDELIYVKVTSVSESSRDLSDRDGRNEDDIRPIMIKFEKLEIDGDRNEILHAIGTEDASTPLIRKVIEEITRRIEENGWRAYLPPDMPQGKRGGLNEDGMSWRPRVPFMRLPGDFFETLPDPKGEDGQWQNYSKEKKESYLRLPEEGGNGLSPLFWYKWWNDKLCNGNGVRIRELAVYGRTGPFGVTEQGFYLPHLRTKLPDGNKQLQREEQRDKAYDGRRREDLERMMDFDSYNENDNISSLEKDISTLKSSADRRILQSVYDISPDQASAIGNITESISNSKTEDTPQSIPTEQVESKVREIKSINDDIIRSIAKPIVTGDWSTLSKKSNKPPPEDNPIFKNWRERVTMAAEIKPKTRKVPLSPYPSDEHFAGIWRLTSTPDSPIMDENEIFEAKNGDPSSNENLILRIDGSIAGGPILDRLNRHRAAGGSWKFFQAEYIGGNEEDESEPLIQTRLRLKLLIPPSKNKFLVMEGEVKKGGITSAESVSRDNVNELRSAASFGINKITMKESTEISKAENDDEDTLYIAGEAWLEDVSPDGNRFKLGRFSMVKKRVADQYTYTVLPPQRYQD